MSWASIPRYLPRWLRRRPLILAQVLALLNRLKRLKTAGLGRVILIGGAVCVLVVLALAFALADGRAALAVGTALSYRGFVVAAAGIYIMALVLKRLREARSSLARSWLVATPRFDAGSAQATVLLLAISVLWRCLAALGVLLVLCLDSSVTLRQALTLGALIMIGAAIGVVCGWALSRRRGKRAYEASRYVLKPKPAAALVPSSAALSRWPIAEAFASSRPENSRYIVLAALLSVPAGIGPFATLGVLAVWVVGSYLVALLVAIPRAARAASEWLRSTPMSFWAFAWPLARRAMLHQLAAVLVAVAALVLLGSPLLTALYYGALWLTLAVTTASISLANCYRARSTIASNVLAVAGTLAIEQRAHGWGVSLALLVAAFHLRAGVIHERA